MIALSIFFATNLSSYAADCPSGYSEKVVTFSIGTCTYDVIICYKCDPTHLNEAYIKEINFDVSQSNCIPPGPTLWNAVKAQINQPSFAWYELCLDEWNASNCEEEEFQEFNIQWPMCLYYERYMDGQIEKIRYATCGTSYCNEKIRTCFNYSTQQYERHVISYDLVGGSPECDEFYHEITLPTTLNTPSDCFKSMSSPCPY